MPGQPASVVASELRSKAGSPSRLTIVFVSPALAAAAGSPRVHLARPDRTCDAPDHRPATCPNRPSPDVTPARYNHSTRGISSAGEHLPGSQGVRLPAAAPQASCISHRARVFHVERHAATVFVRLGGQFGGQAGASRLSGNGQPQHHRRPLTSRLDASRQAPPSMGHVVRRIRGPPRPGRRKSSDERCHSSLAKRQSDVEDFVARRECGINPSSKSEGRQCVQHWRP